MEIKKGKVYLVGAGPGDPGLITVKGLECIRNSEVIIYDYVDANIPIARRMFEKRKKGHCDDTASAFITSSRRNASLVFVSPVSPCSWVNGSYSLHFCQVSPKIETQPHPMYFLIHFDNFNKS